MNRLPTRALTLGAACAALLSLPGGRLSAQAETDSRWLAFVGCWEAVTGEDSGEDASELLCFRLEGQGVTLSQHAGGETVSTETLVADGRRQQVSAEGCEGYESVVFSEDGRRVFTETEFLCGTGDPRRGTGVMAFLGPNVWADIRTLEAGDEPFAWVQEYRLAPLDRLVEEGVDDPAAGLGLAVRSERAAAAARLDLDDVIEASATIDDEAVETWLVARGDSFQPDGDDLVRLADAGVSESVIDVVVAVSHPDRFVVETGGDPEEYRGTPVRGYRGYMAYSPLWGPGWGFSRFGFSPWGWGGGWGLGWGPGWGFGFRGAGWGGPIVIRPRAAGGRIFNGIGYRGPSSGGSVARGGRSAQPRGSVSGSSRSGSQRPAASSGSGSRRATPRSARRRPPGGR